MCSYAKIIHGKQDPSLVTTMMSHLAELQYHWEDVRIYHGIILQKMEMGQLQWRDRAQIQESRTTYAQKQQQGISAGQRRNQVICCQAFQSGGCHQKTVHMSSNGFVRHVCAYCLRRTSKTFNHPEIKCGTQPIQREDGL